MAVGRAVHESAMAHPTELERGMATARRAAEIHTPEEYRAAYGVPPPDYSVWPLHVLELVPIETGPQPEPFSGRIDLDGPINLGRTRVIWRDGVHRTQVRVYADAAAEADAERLDLCASPIACAVADAWVRDRADLVDS